MPNGGSPWLDGPDRYGRVTRILHWAMAALFVWQFVGMGLRLMLGRTPLVAFFVGTHAPLGFLLLLLAGIRLFWMCLNRRRRGQAGHGAGFARIGQGALYLLMVLVPLLALLRLYASGRGFAPFGIPVFRKRENRIEMLMEPADMLHGPLAWLLLLLIAGHVGMAILHGFFRRDGVLRRMV